MNSFKYKNILLQVNEANKVYISSQSYGSPQQHSKQGWQKPWFLKKETKNHGFKK